jgi:hypothetical protein
MGENDNLSLRLRGESSRTKAQISGTLAIASSLRAFERLSVGGRIETPRQMDGEHLARIVSGQGNGRRWLRGHRSRRSHNIHRTATAFTTWRATFGNGAVTGTAPTSTRGSKPQESWWRVIHKALTPATMQVMANPSGCNVEAHFSALISIAPVT